MENLYSSRYNDVSLNYKKDSYTIETTYGKVCLSSLDASMLALKLLLKEAGIQLSSNQLRFGGIELQMLEELTTKLLGEDD